MVSAQRLYERLGFRRDPTHDWSSIPDIHLLAYVLDLYGQAHSAMDARGPPTRHSSSSSR
jgi:hypothetical protein